MGKSKSRKIVLISIFGLDFGVRSISSFLKSKGFEPDLIFFNQKRFCPEFFGNDYLSPSPVEHVCSERDVALLVELIKKIKPGIVGLSVSSTTYKIAKRLTKEIKSHCDAMVVWGGIHAIISPEECIEHADIVCTGEGEYPIWELAEALDAQASISKIKNLWIKQSQHVEKNSLRPLIEDLDILPFADFLESDNKYFIEQGKINTLFPIVSAYIKDSYPIMTSRGCMYQCAYCCNGVVRERYKDLGMYFRRRSVKNVISELRSAVQARKILYVRFWDDVFTCDEAWVEEFCREYKQSIGKPFCCYAQPQNINLDMLKKLRGAGLSLVNIGVQSASSRVTETIFARKQSIKEIGDFAENMKKSGVMVRYDLLTDNPYDNDEDHVLTAELLLKLPYPYQVHFFSLCWFPKTPLTQRALKEGKIDENNLEQNSSKALNNFFMFLSCSKNSRELFWNCIKAMAANRLFPPSWVRFCMGSAVFKKNPRILVFFARNFLKIFAKYSVRLENKNIIVEKLLARNQVHSVIYCSERNLHGRNAGRFSTWMSCRQSDEFILFVLEGSLQHKTVCLRAKNFSDEKKEFSLIFCLSSFASENDRRQVKGTWGVNLAVEGKECGELLFELDLSDMKDPFKGKAHKTLFSRVDESLKNYKGVAELNIWPEGQGENLQGKALIEL